MLLVNGSLSKTEQFKSAAYGNFHGTSVVLGGLVCVHGGVLGLAPMYWSKTCFFAFADRMAWQVSSRFNRAIWSMSGAA